MKSHPQPNKKEEKKIEDLSDEISIINSFQKLNDVNNLGLTSKKIENSTKQYWKTILKEDFKINQSEDPRNAYIHKVKTTPVYSVVKLEKEKDVKNAFNKQSSHIVYKDLVSAAVAKGQQDSTTMEIDKNQSLYKYAIVSFTQKNAGVFKKLNPTTEISKDQVNPGTFNII